jgi:hypothetical protein
MNPQVISVGKLSLAIQSLPVAQAAPVAAPVDHFIVIDISGSMYSDLPELRHQLKNKLSSLVKDKDTVTIVWFSGRGQFGVLVERLEIRSILDLTSLHSAIDRFLQPMGLTGFKEPLQAVIDVIDRISAARRDGVFSLFFMTDGYDNQWSDADILAVCKKLEPKLANAVIVEYGWHCNRPLLTKMAETLGGKLIFSKDLQEYSVTFEKEMSGGTGVKKTPVKLAADASKGYAYALQGANLLTFIPDADNVVLVPEGITEVAYFTTGRPTAVGLKEIAFKPTKFEVAVHTHPLIWASLVALSQRVDSDAIFEVLGALGDVNLVQVFSNCFSKEDYIIFQTFALGAAVAPESRYAFGYDPNAVPKEDAYTVLDLISDLSASDENLFYPHHEAFAYERIGAASLQKERNVRFEYADKSRGYPINGIVWNEDRPNVSVRVRMEGFAVLPADRPAPLPEKVESYVYRNYTIVRDGIVHTRRIPVSLSQATFNKLQANGLLAGEAWAAGKVFVLDYPRLPVINRQMVRGVTAKATFEKVLQLAVLKGTQKVLNDWRDRITPKQSKKFLALYGEAATNYLAERGVSDYNGFNPPSESKKSGDFYHAKELKIAAKGLSSLPKVADVDAAMTAGKKLKVNEFVMTEAVQKVRDFMASSIYTKAADPDALLATWIESESKAAVQATRQLMCELAQCKFAIVVGHTWFADLGGLDNNSLDVDLPGFGSVTVTANLKDAEVAL